MRTRPLRDRSEPMAQALAIVRGARMHGSGRLLLVSGPAGIGKTALLAEILLRVGRDPLTGAPEFGELIRMAGEPLLLADRIVEHADVI